MAKHKVYNNNKFNVGIRFENTGHEVTIRPNTFVLMSDEDIMYVNSVSKLFEKGIIYIEEEELLGQMGFVEKNPNIISEEEIKAIFELNNNRMRNELSKITEKHAIDKVIGTVKKSDLSSAKIKIIGDLFGVNIFEELDENWS